MANEILRKARTKAGVRVRDLANLLGCTDAAYYRWESGEGLPGGRLLVALAEQLKLTPEAIVSGYERGAK